LRSRLLRRFRSGLGLILRGCLGLCRPAARAIAFVSSTNQFDDCHFGGIAGAETNLKDADVTAVPVGKFRCALFEQRSHCIAVANPRNGEAPVMEFATAVVSGVRL